MTLSRSTESIISLANEIHKNIIGVFSQSSFPHFESDLVFSFKTDIKSFIDVVGEAFITEFSQSGIPSHELQKIRMNIQSDCKEIFHTIKCAFEYPDLLKEAIKLKEVIQNEVQYFVTKLNIPFTVVKTDGSEDSSKGQKTSSPEEIEEREKIIRSRKTFADMESATKFIKGFVKRCSQMIGGAPPPKEGTPWDGLDFIEQKVHELMDAMNEQLELISEQKNSIASLKQEFSERRFEFENRENLIEELNTRRAGEIDAANEEIGRLKGRIAELEESAKTEQIRVQGDFDRVRPDLLKEAIVQFIKDLTGADVAEFDGQELKEAVQREINSHLESKKARKDQKTTEQAELLQHLERLSQTKLESFKEGIQKVEERIQTLEENSAKQNKQIEDYRHRIGSTTQKILGNSTTEHFDKDLIHRNKELLK